METKRLALAMLIAVRGSKTMLEEYFEEEEGD